MNENLEKITFTELCDLIEKIFPINGTIAMAYATAVIFKKEIIKATGHFPMLNICGGVATGKTELAKTICSFIANSENTENIKSITPQEIKKILKTNTLDIINFDNYDDKISKSAIDTILSTYGNEDKYSTVIITGKEIPTKDIRLFTRSININMERHYKKSEVFDIIKLCELRSEQSLYISGQELRELKYVFTDYFKSSWYRCNDYLNGKIIADGYSEYDIIDKDIIANWAILCAAYSNIRTYIGSDLRYKDMEFFYIVSKELRRQLNDLSLLIH